MRVTSRLIFQVADGVLRLTATDMDIMAEHLEWCYRFLGIGSGSVIGVQDFGSSSVSYLSSSLLMPLLSAGAVDRLAGCVICLDALEERVLMTPAIVEQIRPDVLVVRADVVGLLLTAARRAAVDFTDGRMRLVVTVGDEVLPRLDGFVRPRYLLNVDSAMLLSPSCEQCQHFHLRDGFYGYEAGRVMNRRLSPARPVRLRYFEPVVAGKCDAGPADIRLRHLEDVRP